MPLGVTLRDSSSSPDSQGQPLGTNANPLVTALSNAQASAISGVYKRSAAVGAGGSDGVLVTGVTTAGTVNLTLANGGTVTVTVPIGSSVLPFSVTAATLGTAVGGTFQSLFYT